MGFPNLPGIPPLRGYATTAAALPAAGFAASLLNNLNQRWGVYKASGDLALQPDSIVEVGYTNTSNLPTAPQEDGAFVTYNKVKNPRTNTVVASKGGSQSDLADFIAALEILENSLDLYTIVTPNKSYTSVNVDSCDYRRNAQSGAGMVVAHIHFMEIRNAQATFSQPGSISPTATVPSAQAAVNNGQQQTTAAPSTTGKVQ